MTKKSRDIFEIIQNYLTDIHKRVQLVNNSKIFAALVVIILNIASRFINVKFSKAMEDYIRNTLSRNLLVFCAAWMGSREIYVALLITLVFMLIVDVLLNEDSRFYILTLKDKKEK